MHNNETNFLKTKGRIVIWVVAVREEEKNGDRRTEKNNIVEDDTARRCSEAAKSPSRRVRWVWKKMQRVSKNVFSTIIDFSISATGYCFATYRPLVKRNGKLEIVGTEADLNSYSIYSLQTQL